MSRKAYEVTFTVRAYGPSPERVMQVLQRRVGLPATSEDEVNRENPGQTVVIEPAEYVQVRPEKERK